MIHDSDKLKKIEDILEPDIRISFWQTDSQDLLSSLHDALVKIKLNDYVHIDVVREFEKAKNIVLYSFYSYSMSSVAIMHAYSCVEKTISLKAKRLNLLTTKRNEKDFLNSTSGLRSKIIFAIDRKWVGKKHFFLYDSNEDEIKEETFFMHLDSWVGLRNSLAHDPAFLNILWRVPEQLEIFANLINAISKYELLINHNVPEINLPKRHI